MKRLLIILFCFIAIQISAQTDAEKLKKIYTNSLTDGMSYQWLDHLSNQIGGRLSGSLNAEKAVQYTKEVFEKLDLDKVWSQPVMVPRWVRGAPEFAYIETSPGVPTNVNICALGGSIATRNGGVKAKIIEVCDNKIAAKGLNVGISFYAFFKNKNDNPELLMEAAVWWIKLHQLNHFEKMV